MIFSNDKAIYVQMADRLCDEIVAGTYKDDDRIPSVREYAVMLQVNTNTAVKAFDQLARDGIIYNKRGLVERDKESAQARVYEADTARNVPTDETPRHHYRRRGKAMARNEMTSGQVDKWTS